jgi:hypothetical protein
MNQRTWYVKLMKKNLVKKSHGAVTLSKQCNTVQYIFSNRRDSAHFSRPHTVL